MKSILFNRSKTPAGTTANCQSHFIKIFVTVTIIIASSQGHTIAQIIDTGASVTAGKADLNGTGNNQFTAGDSLNKGATFPGGDNAFTFYLIRNLRMPENYTERINVIIRVTFTIDTSGNLKDFVASDGPKDLQKEAIRVIKTSGKWLSAYLDGKPITSQRTQNIRFMRE